MGEGRRFQELLNGTVFLRDDAVTQTVRGHICQYHRPRWIYVVVCFTRDCLRSDMRDMHEGVCCRG